MSDRTTVIAVFDDRTQAQRAIADLKRAGFTEKEIGVTLCREQGGPAPCSCASSTRQLGGG
jgi:hypothetical protein